MLPPQPHWIEHLCLLERFLVLWDRCQATINCRLSQVIFKSCQFFLVKKAFIPDPGNTLLNSQGECADECWHSLRWEISVSELDRTSFLTSIIKHHEPTADNTLCVEISPPQLLNGGPMARVWSQARWVDSSAAKAVSRGFGHNRSNALVANPLDVLWDLYNPKDPRNNRC